MVGQGIWAQVCPECGSSHVSAALALYARAAVLPQHIRPLCVSACVCGCPWSVQHLCVFMHTKPGGPFKRTDSKQLLCTLLMCRTCVCFKDGDTAGVILQGSCRIPGVAPVEWGSGWLGLSRGKCYHVAWLQLKSSGALGITGSL